VVSFNLSRYTLNLEQVSFNLSQGGSGPLGAKEAPPINKGSFVLCRHGLAKSVDRLYMLVNDCGWLNGTPSLIYKQIEIFRIYSLYKDSIYILRSTNDKSEE
jgi:hypothetical protein